MIWITLLAACFIYVARRIFKTWINPLSVYSALWAFCLLMYELNLIHYYPISTEAFAYILLAWLCIHLGALMAALIIPNGSKVSQVSVGALRSVILWFSLVGAIALVDQVRVLISHFGSLMVIFLEPGQVYLARTSNEMSSAPYAGSLVYAACCLSGIYFGRTGFVGIGMIPIVLSALQHFFGMGRTGLGVVAILFLAGYFYSGRVPVALTRKKKIALLLGGCSLASGFFVVSAVRGLQTDFVGTTPELEKISEYVPIFPSLYSNFSATPVAFSMYLDAPEGAKQGTFGEYTFAPALRLLASLGFPTSVAPYEESYFTPVPVNTSTYLKNIHSDFGLPGIVLFPFSLGFAVIGLLRRAANPTCLVILAHLCVIVIFSVFYNLMLLGDWYISLFACVIASFSFRGGGSREAWNG